ncbi:uncharacterized protein LY79DRAFT_367326 [Colletotrichum navitas]|uniref:Uncharacterized protein n=1 Tax=Colletotrichum navitas TaxID=681940 RepID=A0AAD8UZ30_9PEZI|nr:uncharacterized protein LY79DRAFT_367326 [Colletotrichum navitas]KAK1574481.1 hypothetical protein LY79DRAFT_367326 [Colletotrichum navitas]
MVHRRCCWVGGPLKEVLKGTPRPRTRTHTHSSTHTLSSHIDAGLISHRFRVWVAGPLDGWTSGCVWLSVGGKELPQAPAPTPPDAAHTRTHTHTHTTRSVRYTLLYLLPWYLDRVTAPGNIIRRAGERVCECVRESRIARPFAHGLRVCLNAGN